MKESHTVQYNEFYRMYAEEMYAYGMAFDFGKETVLDAIHDVFLHIIESESRIDMLDDVKFYLLVSIRNRLISMKRNELSFQSIDDPQESSFSILVNGMEDIVEDDEERNDIIECIEAILNELTDRQREVIYLRYMQEFSYEEIAELLNITPKAARKLTYRAISQIKELYGGPLYVFIQLLTVHTF